ncbi:hypothetical protein RIF29_16135 [Crotalaria pallida]|uniref:Uncharacterized protein n=1 Tax=Crotalaria pallida TaxID=3830 RepID=A0AAN9FG31_CROPI
MSKLVYSDQSDLIGAKRQNIVHSNIHLPECQTFELDESDVLAPVYNMLQNKKIKEYQNNVCIDLKKNEQESEDCMTPKPEVYDKVIDFKNVCQAQVKDTVKDICVDEGVPTKDKFLFDMNVDEKPYNSFPCNEDKEKKEDNIGINVLNLPALEESDQVLANHDPPKDLMSKDEAVTEKLFDDVNKETLPRDKVLPQELGEQTLPGDKVLSQELDKQEPRASDGNDEQVSCEPDSQPQSAEFEDIVEGAAVLTDPTLESEFVEPNYSTGLLESGRYIYKLSPPVLSAVCGKQECHQVGGCKCIETQDTLEPVDGKSNDEAVLSQIRSSLGETSFSGVGHGSSRISYSGPVPYSGSISLRSDSSTTSTRSFAFPVLQSEWNSSPVRMAKADKRNYRKHKGFWKQGLLCCRF